VIKNLPHFANWEVDVKTKIVARNVASRGVYLCAVIILLSAGVFGDTIKLKNGSIFKGKVVTFNKGEFTIVLDFGTSSRNSGSRMTIAAEDVESIEFEAETSATSAPPPVTTAPETVSARPTQEITTERPKDTQPADTGDAGGGTGGAIAEKTVSVSSTQDWTSTDIRVQRGQRISISATGEVDLGNNRRTSPSGISLSDNRKLIPNKPTGGLIAVVGDDNDDFVFIGRSSEFTASHNGILFLSVNEGNLKDNSGSFVAKVRITDGK
jgi:hypothetical protein